MTLFQEFDFGVNIKYDTGRETVKGMSYKLKVSRSSFRMHMRNRTSSSRPVCVTSRRPEKGLCRSDYRYQFISFILRLLIKTSMVACLGSAIHTTSTKTINCMGFYGPMLWSKLLARQSIDPDQCFCPLYRAANNHS